MRIVLTAFSASFSHAPLALYALRAYCAPFYDDITLAPFTTNHTDDYILRSLYEHQMDIIGFSCAVWNIEKTRRIAVLLKKLLPSLVIIFGGPEMADRYEPYLLGGSDAPADVVVPGEGEKPLLALLTRYAEAAPDFTRAALSDIAGIAWVDHGRLRVNPPDAPAEMTALPFPYPARLDGLAHKMMYYEASRGCPFRCGYCLSGASSAGRGARLRLKPLSRVWEELRVFIDARVTRVKFTDRTFNADAGYAAAIWRFLMEQDNGVTNFHFEIAADLLQEDELALLRSARPGLFQFEIGVQSVNPTTLAAVERAADTARLLDRVTRIRSFNNIHLHLDLIAGLPGEDMISFRESFNQTYAARPEQLQLGFLKLLKGAPLYQRADALGLVFSPFPPYEVLSTPVLPYRDLLRLKAVAGMTELFHNSGRFTHTLAYLRGFFPSPFDMFDRLAGFWFDGVYHQAPQGKMRLYEILLSFCTAQASQPETCTVFTDLLRFDMLANENEKRLPTALAYDPPPDMKRRVRARMAGTNTTGHPNPLARQTAYFETDVWGYISGDSPHPAKRCVCLLFSYPQPGRQDPFTLRRRIEEILI